MASGSSSAGTNWNKTLPCSLRKKKGIKRVSCLQLQVIGGASLDEQETEERVSVCAFACVCLMCFACTHTLLVSDE